jgi:guanylate kinase
MSSCLNHKGLVFIVSAPSGGGKSSLIRELLKLEPNVKLSISTTTRTPRVGEVDGADYYFKNIAEFKQLIEQNKLLEYTKIYDNYYGTPKQAINDAIVSGIDILFDIDWQGVKSIRQQMQNVVSVFVLPPSLETLKIRLEHRALDSQEVVACRLKEAANEIQFAKYYDYIVINDQFDKALQQLRAILIAERIKQSRLSNLSAFGVAILN